MSETERAPTLIDVTIDKDARLVVLDIQEGAKRVRLVLPVDTARNLGRGLRDAAHKIGRPRKWRMPT